LKLLGPDSLSSLTLYKLIAYLFTFLIINENSPEIDFTMICHNVSLKVVKNFWYRPDKLLMREESIVMNLSVCGSVCLSVRKRHSCVHCEHSVEIENKP